MLKMLSVKRVNPPCFKDLLADIQRITLIACTLPHKDKHKSISPFYFLLKNTRLMRNYFLFSPIYSSSSPAFEAL